MGSKSYDWLLIDGYSLLHKDPDSIPFLPDKFDEARLHLIRKLQNAPTLAKRTTVVFDGQTGGASYDYGTSALEIFFSPGHLTADTVIEGWVGRHGISKKILVITADRIERDIVSAGGADCMSCTAFLDELRQSMSQVKRRTSRPSGKKFNLGDAFSEIQDFE